MSSAPIHRISSNNVVEWRLWFPPRVVSRLLHSSHALTAKCRGASLTEHHHKLANLQRESLDLPTLSYTLPLEAHPLGTPSHAAFDCIKIRRATYRCCAEGLSLCGNNIPTIIINVYCIGWLVVACCKLGARWDDWQKHQIRSLLEIYADFFLKN